MRVIIAACCFLLSATIASAQTLNPVTPLQNGAPVNSSNPLQVAGTFSASLSGFTPGLTFATLTATASSAFTALPAGTVVFFQNNGTTTVSCTLGVGSATATANEILVPASSGVPVVVGSNTFGACIDQSGSASNLVVLAGGSGLGTPFGGGGGSGGGGAVFGPTAVGSAAANPPVLMGGTANAGATGTVQVAKVDSGGGLFFNGLQGGSALSATNGWYTNILQGNAVLTAANGLYVNVGLGNAANASGNPFYFLFGTGATLPAFAATPTFNLGTIGGAATAANQSSSGSDGSTSIVTGGTAQNLFASATPAHGWEVCNPDPAEDAWLSQSTTAAANGQGSVRIAANGGCVSNPSGMAPFHAISIIAATTAHKITAVSW